MLPLVWAALLGLSACSRSDDPPPTLAPAAPLLAKWEGVRTHQVDTAPSGAVTYDNTPPYPAASYFLEFTATEVLVYAGTSVSKRVAYTRTGNTITPTPAVPGDTPQEIKELTASRLVLTSAAAAGANTRTLTTTYSR